MKLFLTGFIQVYFVAVNTYFISKGYLVGVFTCGFLISWVWSYNVKKVAFGNRLDRLIYSLGAAFGALIGTLTAKMIL